MFVEVCVSVRVCATCENQQLLTWYIWHINTPHVITHNCIKPGRFLTQIMTEHDDRSYTSSYRASASMPRHRSLGSYTPVLSLTTLPKYRHYIIYFEGILIYWLIKESPTVCFKRRDKKTKIGIIYSFRLLLKNITSFLEWYCSFFICLSLFFFEMIVIVVVYGRCRYYVRLDHPLVFNNCRDENDDDTDGVMCGF